ncbi:hypothetical protein [Lentisalinibacter salinarum]|uniref:hypothetical protein n=1 Tax=Lentisalinibacter salinarum TaxID=2992239 RepID=UPI0038693ABF
MNYKALEDNDLRHLAAINRSYLEFLGSNDRHAARQLERLEPTAREMLRRLTPAHRAEAASSPFLLCSVRAVDVGGGADPGTFELFRGAAPSVELVLYMSLSLLRRLAWRRPFAARLLGGVDAAWCDELAGLDEPALAAVAHAQAARLRPVHASVAGFWPELLRCAELVPLRRRAVRAAGLQLQQRLPATLPLRAAASRLQAARRRFG